MPIDYPPTPAPDTSFTDANGTVWIYRGIEPDGMWRRQGISAAGQFYNEWTIPLAPVREPLIVDGQNAEDFWTPPVDIEIVDVELMFFNVPDQDAIVDIKSSGTSIFQTGRELRCDSGEGHSKFSALPYLFNATPKILFATTVLYIVPLQAGITSPGTSPRVRIMWNQVV